MALYDVYVNCDQCGQPHSVHVRLTFEDPGLDRTPLAAQYVNVALPAEIIYMQSNKYRCPHTKQLFPAADIDRAFLFAALLARTPERR